MARATNDVLRDWDLAADTVWWNEGLRTLFGYCVDEIEAGVESWSSRIHPEDRDGILHDVRGVIESDRRSWSGEYRFRRADGTYAVVMDRGYVLHGDDGKPIRMIASMMDVTERRRVEDALRDNEVRMRAILDTALDAVVVMDAHGRITDWNTQAASMFGWSKAEAVGRTAAELIIPSRYQEAHERGLTRLLSTGDGPVLHRRIELTALRRDGTEFPIELAISPLKIRDSYQFTAFISDITERKQAEDRIREQAALLDIAHDAILVRDLQDQIRFWNQGAERLYGWTAAEAIGRTASDLLYQERPDVLEEARVCLLRTG
jgi:PAS domain S-box-containing protein